MDRIVTTAAGSLRYRVDGAAGRITRYVRDQSSTCASHSSSVVPRLLDSRSAVVAGEQDTSTPMAGAEEIQRSIPGARLVTFPCAHLSNVERAAEFTQQGAAFFKG